MPEGKPPERWSKLSDEQKAILEQRLRAAQQDLPRTIPTGPRYKDILYPLSFSQESLWFIRQLQPTLTIHNRPWALRLRGCLDRTIVERCINEIVRRHEVLRSTFSSIDGKPFQKIQPHKSLELPIADLSNLSQEEKEAQAIRLCRERTKIPFDLEQDPMLRPILIQMDQEDHILLLTTHHIAFDGWSEQIFLQEFSSLYKAFSLRKPSPLPERPIQYPDYAQWEREFLQGERLSHLEAFWRSGLKGASSHLSLVSEDSFHEKRMFRGETLHLSISDDLTHRLHELGRKQGCTLFMTLLAAYKITLSIQAKETDILVGTIVAGRKHTDLENAIGLFTNTLVMRTQLAGDPTIIEVMKRVRETTLRAYDHQDLPFERLIEILNPPRRAGYTPLIQAAIQLRNFPEARVDIPGLSIDEFPFDYRYGTVNLSLEIVEHTLGLACMLHYDASLIDEQTAKQFFGEFHQILNWIVDHPSFRLSHLTKRLIDSSTISPSHRTEQPKPTPGLDLTGTQALVWAGQKLRPHEPLYNLAYLAVIHTKIDPDHFNSALQALINGSDALRTVIIEQDGFPLQLVRDSWDFQCPTLDLSDEENPLKTMQDWAIATASRPFDTQESLFDTALIKLSENQWGWLIRIHHIISDNYSVEIIFQRMQMYYEASLNGNINEIQLFPQFEDYVSYEHSRYHSVQFNKIRAYWEEKFSTPLEQLTFYGRRRTGISAHSQRVTLDLGPSRTQKIREIVTGSDFFTKSEDISLLNTFTSLFFAYLHRVSGNRDLSLAISFHNRLRSEFKETIGLFMEALAVRVQFDENETFRSLVKKVTAEMIETLRHRQYPLRNPIHSPIYEIVLNYHIATFSHFLGAAVDFGRVHHGYDEDNLGIHIQDYGDSGSLKIAFDFNCEAFPTYLRDRILSHFECLVDAFLMNPEAPIDQVELFSPDERQQILFEVNQTKQTFPGLSSVVNLLEEQVLETPDQTAVIGDTSSLTYAQLNTYANQIAHHLKKMGVGPDDLIGLFTDRSLEMVIGIWGILKAGCAYLPLDPQHPQERLNFMLDDSGSSIILTQQHLLDRLPDVNVNVLVLDLDHWGDLSNEDDQNLRIGPRPDHLAYVIYTSGSTGLPKGVMVEHRSLMNFTYWAKENWDLSMDDRVLQFTAIHWDAHIEEIFPPLCSGATIVLRREAMLDTFQSFLQVCQDLGITVLDLPTAYWHALSNTIDRENLNLPSSIRLILIGGDRLNKNSVDGWIKDMGGKVKLYNDYGLTECTSIATQYDLINDIHPDAVGVPVGKPISNVQVYILDHHRKPTPIGLPGELWIAGNGLARGYLNRDQLTKDHFLNNFLEGTPGDRVLRTGDLARFLPDGNLEILGRIDQQVKIRGYRVELGEIEATLNEHARVQESVVLLYGDDSGENHSNGQERLAAYYIPNPSSDQYLDNIDFESYLQQKLPAYMIPSIFIALEAFPLTTNGKVDRSALPSPDFSTIGRTRHYQSPRTDLEHQLVSIWEDVLKTKPIGVMDNFFELGGHSLLAVRLFSVIEKRLGVTLPLVTLFEEPTIAHQSEYILNQSPEEEKPIAVAVESNGTQPPFFCVSPTIIDVITYHDLSRNMGTDQPFYALYSPRLGDWRESNQKREEIADQFIEKIQEIDPEGPHFIGGYSAGGILALEIAQRLRKQNRNVGLLVLFDTFGPNYPTLLPWVNPWMFKILVVFRRIESYLWKFRILDWKGRLNYLRLPRIRSWLRNRYSEMRPPIQSKTEKDESQNTLGRRDYCPKIYDGDVLLIRAEKSLWGIQQDPEMGWGQIFTGNFEILMVPGDHEAILFGPRSQYVARKLIASFKDASDRFRQSSVDL